MDVILYSFSTFTTTKILLLTDTKPSKYIGSLANWIHLKFAVFKNICNAYFLN